MCDQHVNAGVGTTPVRVSRRLRSGRSQTQSHRKRVSIKKQSGNEFYYTEWYLQVIVKHSCSKLHCQIVFKLKLFSYKISRSIAIRALHPRQVTRSLESDQGFGSRCHVKFRLTQKDCFKKSSEKHWRGGLKLMTLFRIGRANSKAKLIRWRSHRIVKF